MTLCICGHSDIRHAVGTGWCIESVDGESCKGCVYYTPVEATKDSGS